MLTMCHHLADDRGAAPSTSLQRMGAITRAEFSVLAIREQFEVVPPTPIGERFRTISLEDGHEKRAYIRMFAHLKWWVAVCGVARSNHSDRDAEPRWRSTAPKGPFGLFLLVSAAMDSRFCDLILAGKCQTPASRCRLESC